MVKETEKNEEKQEVAKQEPRRVLLGAMPRNERDMDLIDKKEIIQQKPEGKKEKIIFATGKRKRAVARASIKKGKGIVKINSIPVNLIEPEMIRLRIMEPLMIAGDSWRGFDIKVTTRGGGKMGQADASRMAIARGLVEAVGKELKAAFIQYDRNLLAYDSRRTEPHKPPRSSQGPRRYKQRSKR